jgi:TolA-binding protein
MLKLAMSLDRLGQRDAACQAYSELGARYPNPPQHVRDRVKSERQRVGCR